MKKALISPNENNRICEVRDTEFEIAAPLFWVDCVDYVTTEWTYVDGEFIEPTPVVPTPPTAEENKATAKLHLLDTDWVELPSVTDTTEAIYLTNKPDFISYRSAIRAIAINPTAGDLVWPVLPESEWSN
jgi:hypothetical protein